LHLVWETGGVISEGDMLGRFEKVRRLRDGEWLVTCPAHNDRNPSLHLALTDDRWLVQCQAGCASEDVLTCRGLEWSDLFSDNGHREIVAEYDYNDERGELLFQVVRFWPKDFRQRRPDGNGGWLWKLANTRRVLYRLPRVIAGVEAGEPVYVAEGESDVHALERAGVVATCNPGGAGKWRTEYNDVLKGATVVVVQDRDDKGREHALQVVESLDGIATSVELVEPVVGKDAADFLTAGKTIDEFVPVDRKRKTATPAKALDALWDMETALVEAEQPLPYLIHPLATRGFATELVAKHSSFKSWLLICAASRCHHLAVRGASESEDFAGLTCHPARALYVDAENGRRLMGRRFRAAGIPADGLLVADGSCFPLLKKIDDLQALIEATEADLVVIDSLRRMTPGADEDSSRDMAPVVAALGELARDLDVAVVFIHHQSSKPGAPPSRGSSAIEDQADAVLRLKRYPGNRLKLWVGAGGKFRMDEEPAPIWIRMSSLGGVFAAGVADPADDEEGDEVNPAPVTTAENVLIEKINRLAPVVKAERGWAPGHLAAAVRADPQSGTYKRAMGSLLESGAWEAWGKSQQRRVCPSEDFVRECHKGQVRSGQPLGDDLTDLTLGEGL
jgi:hypothetical protein